MANTLILYSTTDGHTREICSRLQQQLESRGDRVTLLDIEEAAGLDPAAYDKIVIGASIRYGKHSRKIAAFIRRHFHVLEQKPSAFFSVNLVARKAEKNQPATNPYLKRFLKQIPWKPKHLAVFAGKLDYPSYSAWDRLIIRLIMRVTGGPTDPSAVVEFTDWERVEAFGRLLADLPTGTA
jgi:menaquinone-dependent protoporphyrinogen oxidase